MSGADVYSLAPYLVLTVALLVLLLAVGFARNHLVAAAVTVAPYLASRSMP